MNVQPSTNKTNTLLHTPSPSKQNKTDDSLVTASTSKQNKTDDFLVTASTSKQNKTNDLLVTPSTTKDNTTHASLLTSSTSKNENKPDEIANLELTYKDFEEEFELQQPTSPVHFHNAKGKQLPLTVNQDANKIPPTNFTKKPPIKLPFNIPQKKQKIQENTSPSTSNIENNENAQPTPNKNCNVSIYNCTINGNIINNNYHCQNTNNSNN